MCEFRIYGFGKFMGLVRGSRCLSFTGANDNNVGFHMHLGGFLHSHKWVDVAYCFGDLSPPAVKRSGSIGRGFPG